MIKKRYLNSFIFISAQIAEVAKTYGECGKDIFPGLYVKIDDPKVLRFIQNVSSMAEKVPGN